MPSANLLTRQIIKHIFDQGGFAWRASSVGIFDRTKGIYRTAPKKGVADVLGCYNSKLIAIEIKIGKDRLSLEQEGFLASVNHAGGLQFVAKDFPSFLLWWQKNVV